MNNADYKAERREEARLNHICTMCLKRKGRTKAGRELKTCGKCSREAGIRRDKNVAKAKKEATRLERSTQKARSTGSSRIGKRAVRATSKTRQTTTRSTGSTRGTTRREIGSKRTTRSRSKRKTT